MRVRGAVCVVVLVVGVMAYPSSLQADSEPRASFAAPARASVTAPARISDPTVTQPDPAITWDPASKVYRMYTSATLYGFVPEWKSSTLTGPWTFVRDALPVRSAWAIYDFTNWAPEVANVNGVWTMWGSAAMGSAFCLYRATAKTAAGPFVPDPRLMPCDVAITGDIDPTMVHFSGQWWLIYKTNGNGAGVPDTFVSIRIGSDGWITGPSHVVMTATEPWEAGMIEAPSMVDNNGQWWVVFSAGDPFIASPTYHVAAAPCEGPTGPCNINSVVSLVTTNAQGSGPGEQSVFTDARGQTWLAYNPSGFWVHVNPRPLALARLGFDIHGTPYVGAP
jgi:hypothetical protein